DSRLVLEPRGEGELIVSVADRFGDGGPEYAYRLTIGPPRAALHVTLQSTRDGSEGAPSEVRSGALNLPPGMSVPVSLRVAAEGRPGPVTLRALGLPPGVEAAPVTVRIPRPLGAAVGPEAGAVETTLVLRVDAGAGPATGNLRIVAIAPRADGSTL